jgi:hypothetical protein
MPSVDGGDVRACLDEPATHVMADEPSASENRDPHVTGSSLERPND